LRSDANKRICFTSKFIIATDEAKFKRAAWLDIALVFLRSCECELFSHEFLALTRFFWFCSSLGLCMWRVLPLHLYLLALKTLDLAPFPHNDLMASSWVSYTAMGLFSSKFLISDHTVSLFGISPLCCS
jgi:hypothetical protein